MPCILQFQKWNPTSTQYVTVLGSYQSQGQTRGCYQASSDYLEAQFSKEQRASLIYKHGSQNIWKNQITGPKAACSFAVFHDNKSPRFPDLHGLFNKGFLSPPNRSPLLAEISFPRGRYFPLLLENLECQSLETTFNTLRGELCPHPNFQYVFCIWNCVSSERMYFSNQENTNKITMYTGNLFENCKFRRKETIGRS